MTPPALCYRLRPACKKINSKNRETQSKSKTRMWGKPDKGWVAVIFFFLFSSFRPYGFRDMALGAGVMHLGFDSWKSPQPENGDGAASNWRGLKSCRWPIDDGCIRNKTSL